MVQAKTFVVLAALSFIPVQAIDLNVNSTDSIKSTASTIAHDLVAMYKGNQTDQIPGLLPETYNWWEAGAMFDTLIQYWHLTGDSQYNPIVSQGLLFQRGQDDNFMPTNQSKDEGNDDQDVWALAAMSAAESNLSSPAGSPSWISLASAVFDAQVLRWDAETCGGGLRWQIFLFNSGYNYKNSISNGAFFQLASRLARYTGNDTYSDWAEKAFNWATTVKLVDDNWNVYDGAQTTSNCTDINHLQYSYTAGTFITGAAHMYNITTGDVQATWKKSLDGLLARTLDVFFPDSDILTEIACESGGKCSTDMKAFKGLLSHWLVDTIQVAPYTKQTIIPKLSASAEAAAKTCNDGGNGVGCSATWDAQIGSTEGVEAGVGGQLSALSVVQGLLVGDVSTPATQSSGSGSAGSTPSSASGASGASHPSATGSTPTAPASASASGNVGAALGVDSVRVALFSVVLGSVTWLML